MSIAFLAASQCSEKHLGREVGAVIVDPEHGNVVAVAGDARWNTAGQRATEQTNLEAGEGRPEHHAVMRAIAMVAGKQTCLPEGLGKSSETSQRLPNELDGRPLTAVETEALWIRADAVNGQVAERLRKTQGHEAYLCTGLDLYLTHEPCVCCSMAMIHSRFRACVFANRMRGTGGLTAERDGGGLGYGLFWRKELNWRFPTFEYTPKSYKAEAGAQKTKAVFHA